MAQLWDFVAGFFTGGQASGPGVDPNQTELGGDEAEGSWWSGEEMPGGATGGGMANIDVTNASLAGSIVTSLDDTTAKLFLVVPPLLILLGLLGNNLSLLVLSNRRFPRTPSSILLSLTLLVDSFLLAVDLFPSWIGQVTDGEKEIRANRWGCRCHMFLQHSFRYLSSWMMVSLVLERTISHCAPVRAKSWFTNRSLGVYFLFLCSVLVGTNLHFLWTADYISDSSFATPNNYAKCQLVHLVRTPESILAEIYIWYNFIIGFALPLLIVSTGVFALACNPCRIRSKGSYSTDEALCKTRTWTTAMVMAMGAVFVITTPPIYLVSVMFYYLGAPDNVSLVKLIFLSSILWFYVRQATNFLIFILSGAHFRHTAVAVVSYRRRVLEPARYPQLPESSIPISREAGPLETKQNNINDTINALP